MKQILCVSLLAFFTLAGCDLINPEPSSPLGRWTYSIQQPDSQSVVNYVFDLDQEQATGTLHEFGATESTTSHALAPTHQQGDSLSFITTGFSGGIHDVTFRGRREYMRLQGELCVATRGCEQVTLLPADTIFLP